MLAVLLSSVAFPSAAPGALLFDAGKTVCYETRGIDQGGSGEGHVCIPAGEHIVFAGDSTMRYQYEHLAYAVRHGHEAPMVQRVKRDGAADLLGDVGVTNGPGKREAMTIVKVQAETSLFAPSLMPVPRSLMTTAIASCCIVHNPTQTLSTISSGQMMCRYPPSVCTDFCPSTGIGCQARIRARLSRHSSLPHVGHWTPSTFSQMCLRK